MLQRQKQRDYRIDNIRWLLILLVVFGHLIETVPEGLSPYLYTAIYMFHMPAFVFLTGYFAKFKVRRLVVLALAYAVFQTLYLLFDWWLSADADAPIELQYLTPNWIMWYLLATFVWILAIPLFKTTNRMRMAVTLAVSIAIAIAAGFFGQISYFLSISRIMVFAPFFIAGFYARTLVAGKDLSVALVEEWPLVRRAMLAVGLVGAFATCVVVATGDVNPAALYNSMSYGLTGSSAGQRLGMMALAACWICLLFAVVPDMHIPAISNAGAHTMSVYLIHGFIVKALRAYVDLPFGDVGIIVVPLAIALMIVFALGNRFLDKVVRFGL